MRAQSAISSSKRKAHINVQKWIGRGAGLRGRALTTEGHSRDSSPFLGALLPDDLLWVEDPATKMKRNSGSRQVNCARGISEWEFMVPVSPGAVLRFMARFEEVLRTP